jgi:hypothetical protein
MKTRPKNIAPVVLRGLPPLDKLELADRTGWTVEGLINEGILELVPKCQAKTQLKTKTIRFPKAVRVAYKAKVK